MFRNEAGKADHWILVSRILEGNALGDGICVAVLDTELWSYPDLKSRVLEFQDFDRSKKDIAM